MDDEEIGGIGPHCEVERLIAYRQGTMPAAEREEVQEHLSLCPRCTSLLLELREFEAAAARGDTGPEALRNEAWDSLVRRLPAERPAVLPVAAPRQEPRRWSRGWSPRLALAAAATLLSAVLGLALWQAARPEAAAPGETAQDQIAEPAPRRLEVSLAPRFVLRGQETPAAGLLRAGGVVNPVRLAPGEDGFEVALSVAPQPAYEEYRVELAERGGRVLWEGRRPGRSLFGDDGASVSVRGLGPGLYRLRVAGLRDGRDDGGEPLAEYLLDVEPVSASRR